MAIKEVLCVKNLTKSYAKEKTLRDLSFSGYENEVLAFIGPSGCGKTTLLNILAGIEKKDRGEIKLFSNTNYSAGEVSYMQQQNLLLGWRNVEGNIKLPLEIAKVKKEKSLQKVRKIAHEFDLDGVLHMFPHELSGGMRQRVALMRSIVHDSNTLLLDEPFHALDGITKNKLHIWLQQVLLKHPRLVILVTHDVDEALILADRVYVLTKRGETSIKEVFDISLEKPRDLKTTIQTGFVKIKSEILKSLES